MKILAWIIAVLVALSLAMLAFEPVPVVAALILFSIIALIVLSFLYVLWLPLKQSLRSYRGEGEVTGKPVTLVAYVMLLCALFFGLGLFIGSNEQAAWGWLDAMLTFTFDVNDAIETMICDMFCDPLPEDQETPPVTN